MADAPMTDSASDTSPNAPVPHSTRPAASTICRTASAVTAGIVRTSMAGRRAGPPSRARSPATAALVCSSWSSIRSRWAASSRFLVSTSEAPTTVLIESSDMPKSRSRLMT
jgi:hypothetical protein